MCGKTKVNRHIPKNRVFWKIYRKAFSKTCHKRPQGGASETPWEYYGCLWVSLGVPWVPLGPSRGPLADLLVPFGASWVLQGSSG